MNGPGKRDEAARDRLVARREELRRLLESGAEAAAPVELDQARVGRLSRMDALQHQAMAKDALRRRQQEIARIEAALRRLEEGDYGWCAGCGEAIAPGRLELDPAAALCAACAGRR